MQAISIRDVCFEYKDRPVLKGISFDVERGEIFGMLGPNGSGKTTLFKLLSTLFQNQSGEVSILGFSLVQNAAQIRKKIGVVFQSPSLDLKLKVRENLIHQGHLFGLSGRTLQTRIEEMLLRAQLSERAGDRAETLSGGMKRKLEVAKALLHNPELLILDEPSTGLDPGARRELWNTLKRLREERGVTVLLTTHLMEEAEQCDRIALMNEGNLVRTGSPEFLKKEIGGEVIVICTKQPKELSEKIKKGHNLETAIFDGEIHIEHKNAAPVMLKIAEAFSREMESITLRRPGLEDVFLHHTGKKFEEFS